MKKYFFLATLLFVFSAQNLFAENGPVKFQDVSQEKMKEQNLEITALAVKALSKNLPQKIDKYTTLESIKNHGTTLLYTFTINDANKSDAAIQKQDHSRMKKVVTEGLCKTSKRFLEAGIDISYVYLSAKSNKQLFRFDVTKEQCHYPSAK